MGRKKGVGYTVAERAKRAATKAMKAHLRVDRALRAAETRHVNRCLAENLAAFKAEELRIKRGLPLPREAATTPRAEAIGGTQ